VPIDKLSDSVASAKSFLDAASQQQATELLFLQDTIKQHSDLTKSIAVSSEKLNQASYSHALSDSSWPHLSAANPSNPQELHPALLIHSNIPFPATAKLCQRVELALKQLLIEYGPLEENEAPRDKSIEAQHELRQLFNDWIDNCMTTPKGEVAPPPSRAVRSVSILTVQLCFSNLSLQLPGAASSTYVPTTLISLWKSAQRLESGPVLTPSSSALSLVRVNLIPTTVTTFVILNVKMTYQRIQLYLLPGANAQRKGHPTRLLQP
jgi:hypothetical protein